MIQVITPRQNNNFVETIFNSKNSMSQKTIYIDKWASYIIRATYITVTSLISRCFRAVKITECLAMEGAQFTPTVE